MKCHGPEKQKGDLRLDERIASFDPVKDRELWQSVAEQLDTREMPPKKPLPPEADYQMVLGWLEEEVIQVDWDKVRHPGHVTLPRLTRAEYNHTIRDLLGLDTRAGDIFSPDGEGKSGFTNDRDNLFLTASELEKAFTAAELTVDALQSLGAEQAHRKLEAEDMFMTESSTRVEDFSNGARGYTLTSGQKTIYESIEITHHGFYRFVARVKSTTEGDASGLLRINDQLLAEFPVRGRSFQEIEAEVFLLPGIHQLAMNTRLPPRRKKGEEKTARSFAELPDNAADLVSERSQNAPAIPAEVATGKDVAPLVERWNGLERNVQRPYEWLRLHGPKGNPNELKRFQTYVDDRSEPLGELKIKIAGLLDISIPEFDKRYQEWNAEKLKDRELLYSYENSDPDPDPGVVSVDWIRFEGPIMPSASGDGKLAAAAATALAEESGNWDGWFPDFITRAFREPVTEETLSKYLGIYEVARAKEGEGHAAAARRAVSAVLVSPRFLFRSEELPKKPGDEIEKLTDFQLASRLSYFLWQSCPDEELRQAAADGTLSSEDGLRKEVVRMLEDDRATALFDTFPGQWLGYESVGVSVNPDGGLFPEFSTALAQAMKEETGLLFQRVFRENREIMELISSRETYLNQALGRHYGIPGRSSREMELVSLSPEQQRLRGGILGMGSVLTASSTPVRTSPVLRGVFIKEKLLGEDPGEPPADAGTLPGNAGNRGKTLREELEIHRDREDCAFCHDKIDPLGFGLEEFDAIGRVKVPTKKNPVDAVGTLPDGTTFHGVADLRDYLVTKRSEDFQENLAKRLLGYALGRELQDYDKPAVSSILERTREEGSRARALVESIVLSYPFQLQHISPEFEIPGHEPSQ